MKCETETAHQKDPMKTHALHHTSDRRPRGTNQGRRHSGAGQRQHQRPDAEGLLSVRAGQLSVKGLLPVMLEEAPNRSPKLFL